MQGYYNNQANTNVYHIPSQKKNKLNIQKLAIKSAREKKAII